MKLTVNRIKHILTEDIDSVQWMDVATIDGFISSCTSAAQNAIANAAPPGFTDFERDQLRHVIQGQRYSHLNIRSLLRNGETPESVDALAIARLQLETLYSFCFMLQGAENVRVFLKHGWKKKYIRFLLQREEYKNLVRFREFLETQALPSLERLQQMSGVTEEEKLSIEYEQLGVTPPPGFKMATIRQFPTPRIIIREIRDPDRKGMLERLYPEYEFLCSFAHGDSEATLFRAILDTHSEARRFISRGQAEDFWQQHVAETAIIYSAISAVQAATEVAAIYPADVDLLAKVTTAWSGLIRFSLLARPIWERRAMKILPLI